MSPACQAVRRIFDLPARRPRRMRVSREAIEQIVPAPGAITLVTGASGSGKSSLLKMVQKHAGASVAWINPASIRLERRACVDCVCNALAIEDPEQRTEQSLELLGRVGLAEAWTYLQTPDQLSDGQRWRLILALGIAHAMKSQSLHVTTIIAMDEFAALLDRVTACVVARALRRLVDRVEAPRLGAIVVTSHDDLIPALDPERHAICDFGQIAIHQRTRVTCARSTRSSPAG